LTGNKHFHSLRIGETAPRFRIYRA